MIAAALAGAALSKRKHADAAPTTPDITGEALKTARWNTALLGAAGILTLTFALALANNADIGATLFLAGLFFLLFLAPFGYRFTLSTRRLGLFLVPLTVAFLILALIA